MIWTEVELPFEVTKSSISILQSKGHPIPGTPQLFKFYSSLDTDNLLVCSPNDCPYLVGMRGWLHFSYLTSLSRVLLN